MQREFLFKQEDSCCRKPKNGKMSKKNVAFWVLEKISSEIYLYNVCNGIYLSFLQKRLLVGPMWLLAEFQSLSFSSLPGASSSYLQQGLMYLYSFDLDGYLQFAQLTHRSSVEVPLSLYLGSAFSWFKTTHTLDWMLKMLALCQSKKKR